MIKEASAMKVRQNLGELINEVQYRHDSVVITRAGKPVAAIVDIARFEKMRLLEEEFDHTQKELQNAFQGESAEAIDAVLEQAKHASRQTRK